MAVIALVGLHTLLLAAYTFPRSLVPERLRVIGQAYARPFFHQEWKLFAPDPPLCACELQYSQGGAWMPIDRGPDHWLQRRAVLLLAYHLQARVHAGDERIPKVFVPTFQAMTLYSSYEPGPGRPPPPGSRIRLVEQCVEDPAQPRSRVERITLLRWP